MVDWDAVEKRRGQGWDWDRIAEDPKVEFHADPSMGSPGRALRALYYRNKSRKPTEKPRPEGQGKAALAASERRWSLARIGYLLLPLFFVWFVLALIYPSLVAFVLPAIPYLLLLVGVAAAILAYGLYRVSGKRWTPVFRNTVLVGALVGVVVGAGIAGVAYIYGCPNLTTATTSQIQGWERADNPAWTVNGVPVFMFYGSAACPYCAASSWAVLAAMMAVGTVTQSQLQFGYSSPGDLAGSNIPYVLVSSIQVQSSWVAPNWNENTYNQTIMAPGVDCVVQAYVNTYNSGGSIPFFVVNGQFIRVGSLISTPTVFEGLTWEQLYGEVTSKSGTQYTTYIEPQSWMLQAVIVKVNNGQPASSASNPNVASLVSQLT